ncbi:MAG: DNA helicase UvrD, partial [Coriobacteriales bacterium]
SLRISEADGRNFDGAPRYPSRFILDIDQSLLQYDDEPREDLIQDARNYIAANERSLAEGAEFEPLHIGTKVHHKVFGDGVISDVDIDKSAYKIDFEGLQTSRKISFNAPLELLGE